MARLHTPRMSLRKKSLFEGGAGAADPGACGSGEEEDWEAESLGALGLAALDSSSSGDEREAAPQPHAWRETRSRTKRMLKEAQDLNDFIKSPYTLRNYASRQHDTRRLSTMSVPATPYYHRLPQTPSSSHSCNSAHTTTSGSCRARKSLASLIADTESCSSSLKDLNFDSDSGTDAKENTPTKATRKSVRRRTMTPKFASFKGILSEHKKNVTPSPTMCFAALEKDLSPNRMLKTPHNSSEVASPPKLAHRRTVVDLDESPEETEHRNKRHWNDSLGSDTGPNPKNLKLDTSTGAPKARLSLFSSDKLKEILTTKSFYPKTKVEVSPTVATKISKVISATHCSRPRHARRQSHGRRGRQAGEINMGVRHRIRKPKPSKYRQMISLFVKTPVTQPAQATASVASTNASFSSLNTSQNSTTELLYDREKGDPFAKEHSTIDYLLSQWGDDEVPSTELQHTQSLEEANDKIRKAKTLLCFNKSIIEENNILLNPNTAVLVGKSDYAHNTDGVIMELGCTPIGNVSNVKSLAATFDNTAPMLITDMNENNAPEMRTAFKGIETAEIDGNAPQVESLSFNGRAARVYGNTSKGNAVQVTGTSQVDGEDVEMSGDEVESHGMVNGQMPKSGQFLPVEGGYLLVEGAAIEGGEELTDLDAIERELAELDDQLCSIAQRNNIDPELILEPTGAPLLHEVASPIAVTAPAAATTSKLFPIFDKTTVASSAASTPTTPKGPAGKRAVIKTGLDQYVIDAGQKRFGATQCSECSVVYQIGDAQDEHDHLLYHNAVDVLRFPGWREERVAGVYSGGRVVCVRGADPHWRRVSALLERVVHAQLGYAAALPSQDKLYAYAAYLYISKKQIVGCLVAEPKRRAHKLVEGEVDCISVEEYPVKCGVSRLWTHNSHRRRGVATSLLNCMRASFVYGHVLDLDELAFSAPTPAGKAFAANYTGARDFLVYLD